MSDKTRAAMQKALNLIEGEWPDGDEIAQPVMIALREALDHSGEAAEMVQPVWSAEECDRVVKTLRYIQGIAERGEGRAMREDETLEQFVLGYVKKLEQPVSQEPVRDSFIRERQQLEQEWCELRKLQQAYTAPQLVSQEPVEPLDDNARDNMLLWMIQRHFPSLPLSDEYTDWGRWLGFANAVFEAGRKDAAPQPVKQEPVSTDWTPPNYTDEQWQKLDHEYQDHVAEQALQKLLDFHQSIEHDGHWSDCSTHNEPAYPNGECDCGGYPAEQTPVTCPNLQPVINWLENGCDPKEAAKELRIYQERMNAAPQPDMNLSCKSVQKRLATLWGYVKTEPTVNESLTVQEPVAIVTGYYGGRLTVTPFNLASTLPTGMALYTAPQPVKEVELTDDEIDEIEKSFSFGWHHIDFARAVIAKYKEKNKC